MSALIPPVAPSCHAAEPFHPSTTPWDGTLAAIFLAPEIWNHGFTRMNTDKRNKMKVDCLQEVDFESLFLCRLGFFPSFLFIRVHPCESVVPNGFLPRRAMSCRVGYF